MKKVNSLYIVMPAYNEEDNMKDVVLSWYLILDYGNEDSRLVVADNGSIDSTHQILLDLKRNGYPKLEILENTDKGHGPKVIGLYKYAIENNVDYVFQTDSDGQTSPLEFESFWNLKDEYVGIFGNRTKRGDGKQRAFIEKVVCFLLKIFFGVDVPDANAPFRLMNVKTLSKYIDKLPKDYNLPNIMITTYFKYFNERITFKEISFKSRSKGTNSINIPKIIKIGMGALRDFRQLKKEM